MKKKKIMDVNERQKKFYDSKEKNLPTKLWSYLRNGLLNRLKKGIGVEKDIYELHCSWFGDLSNKRVLDLGCYAGNSLSLHLAQNSEEYLGIDLSPRGIESLSNKIKTIKGARAEVKDFLSDDFLESDFDLIYAYGVLHHFKDVNGLITKLNEKLAPKGYIISHDPLRTSLPIKFLRMIYRPFQSDKDWEWPFSRKVYYKFEDAFDILDRRAVLGKAKWTVFWNFLPLSEVKKYRKARQWHTEDWQKSVHDDKHMFSCMHLSMLMRKKS